MAVKSSGLPISNQLAPTTPAGNPGDPIALRVDCDFSAGGVAQDDFDLVKELEQNEIGIVQFVYIDNKNNAAAFTLVCLGTEIDITVKANTQGWYPVLCGNLPMFRATSTVAGTNRTRMFFVNVAMPTMQWLTV